MVGPPERARVGVADGQAVPEEVPWQRAGGRGVRRRADVVRVRAERGAGGEDGACSGAPRGEVRRGGRVGEPRLHRATLRAPASDIRRRNGLDGACEAVPGDERAEPTVGLRGEPVPAAPP